MFAFLYVNTGAYKNVSQDYVPENICTTHELINFSSSALNNIKCEFKFLCKHGILVCHGARPICGLLYCLAYLAGD